MKVCVVGAGAIGGLLGARLAAAGHQVSLIARGPHLAAIQARGLRVSSRMAGEASDSVVKNVTATDNFAALGAQDVVLMALKSHQIVGILDQLPALFGASSVLVTFQNGIPWWYFQRWNEAQPGHKYADHVLQSVDPGGVLGRAMDAKRLLGCVAYPAAVIKEPGVIHHLEGMRFPLGELDGSDSRRVNRVARMFIEAGFKAPVLADIRAEIWLKALGNSCFNPISALTHATLEGICQFPLSRQLAADMMREASQVAEKLGVDFRVSIERRIAGAEQVGRHKTSMLQDVEAGKPLEINAILGAVIELAELTATATPMLRAIYACASLLNHTIVKQGLAVKGRAV